MENSNLDYTNLENIAKISKNDIYFKDGRKLHTDNFTFVDVFKTQEELENFDRKVLNIFFKEPLKEQKLINIERDLALLSLDKNRILAYLRKYNIPQDENLTEEEFWASVHYSILNLRSANEKQKNRSKNWLLMHNYSV